MYRLITASLVVVGTFGLGERASADPITLDNALQRAAQRPSVEGARLGIDEAHANARGAALPLYNPEMLPRRRTAVRLGGALAASWDRAPTNDRAGRQTLGEDAGCRHPDPRRSDHEPRCTSAGAHRSVADVPASTRTSRPARYSTSGRNARARARDGHAKERGSRRCDEASREPRRRRRRTRYARAHRGRQRVCRCACRARDGHWCGAAGAPRPSGTVTDPVALADSIDNLVARALRENPNVLATDNTVAEAKARVTDADARGVSDLTLGVAYEYDPNPEGSKPSSERCRIRSRFAIATKASVRHRGSR